MKISELENCPDWLKNANTEDANVEIIDGVVHWYRGSWKAGTWERGTWHNGDWDTGDWMNGTWWDGTWKSGIWHNGRWLSGVWHTGTWNSGTWVDGTWEGGAWYGGVWEKGTWKGAGNQHQRIKYSPSLRKDKTITIGCKTKTREEWDKWFAGTEEYKTPRGTPTFKLIVANYKAFIAYAEELELIPKK